MDLPGGDFDNTWIKAQRWQVVEQLPSYSPDLDPVELVWGRLRSGATAKLALRAPHKGGELAALCPEAIGDA